MNNNFEIRLIKETDCAETLAVYAPYVLNTSITFEYEVPSYDEYLNRIKTNTIDYPWLVCLFENKIIGFAYVSKFRARSAYQWSPESTIYMSESFQGKGIASILYHTLFDILKLQGFYNVYAGLLIPNEKSERLHIKLGFEEIGVFKKVGYKLGKWHDTKWFQIHLLPHLLNPEIPLSINDISEKSDFKEILKQANQQINSK